MVLLMVVFAASTALSSCKDDKDEPKGGSELVGTWYLYDDGVIYNQYFFIFKNDGTVVFNDIDVEYTGTYTYDSTTGILVINWKNGDVERGHIISNNILDIDDDYFIHT